MAKTILITGATGNISSGIIANLKGSAHRIRALVRNPQKAAALTQQGIEVHGGDFLLGSLLRDQYFDRGEI